MRSAVLWSEALLNATRTPPEEPEPNPVSHDPLIPRHMHDSYAEIVLPFGSSSEVMEAYTNASGGIRTGKYVSL